MSIADARLRCFALRLTSSINGKFSHEFTRKLMTKNSRYCQLPLGLEVVGKERGGTRMAEKHSFWSTIPGMLTGIAAIISAVGGLMLILYQTGFLDNKEKDGGGEVGLTVVMDNSESQEVHAPIGQKEEVEPNEHFSEATPISVDANVKAYLTEGNDIDVFTFETEQEYRNVFEITLSNQGSFAPDISIFDAMKNRIDNKYSMTPGADLIVPLSARPSTKYFIKVKDFDGFKGRLGDYQLTVKSN